MTACAAPEEEDCEGAGNLALKCNRTSLVARETDGRWDQEPDGRRDRETLASGAGTITTNAAPEEEDCEGAGDLAIECNRASPVAQEPDGRWDGNQMADRTETIWPTGLETGPGTRWDQERVQEPDRRRVRELDGQRDREPLQLGLGPHENR